MMWKPKAIRDTADLYRNQFEWEGGKLYFRRNQKGPPVAVSEVEAGECVEQFEKRLMVAYAVGILSLLAVLVPIIAFQIVSGFEDEWRLWAGIGLWAVFFGALFHWAWRGPTRRFDRRAPAGVARSSETLRKKMLAERSWGEVFALGGSGLALPAFQIANWPPAGIGDWVWVSFAVFMTTVTIVSVVMKSRLKPL